MKKLTKTILFFTCIFMIATTGWTKQKDNKTVHNATKQHWVCETNASSSSNTSEQKADTMMKTAKSGKEAFDFALKHCRDCTKITCSLQTKNNTNTNNTNTTNQY